MLWCGPFPLARTRPLTEEEDGLLRQMSRRLSYRRWGYSVLCVGLFFVLQASTVRDHSPFPELFRPWIFLFGCLLPLSLIFPIARAAFLQKEVRQAHASDQVCCFEGPMPERYPARWWKIALRGWEMEAHGMQQLEVAADAENPRKRGVLIRVNGKIVDTPRLALLGSVAENANTRMSQHLASFGEPGPSEVHLERRHLTAQEKAELESEIRHCRWGNIRLEIAAIALIAAGFGYFFGGLGPQGSWSAQGAIVGTVIPLGFFCQRRLRRWELSRRLKEDWEDGRILLVRSEEAKITETLPHSRAVWTVDGIPAPWRLAFRRGRS